MQRTIRAFMLVLAITASVNAGDMGEPVTTPAPPKANATQETPEPISDTETPVIETVTEAALSLLQNLLVLI